MNILNQLDLNKRVDCLLEAFKGTEPGFIKNRIGDLLPLLSLHKKTASLGALGLLACRITELDFRQNTARSFFQVTPGIAYIGFSAIAPLASLGISSGSKAYTILTSSDPALKKITLIVHQAIYVASVYYATPGLMALSLACQIVAELHEATKGFTQRPSSLKDLVNVMVACGRLSQVHSHIQKAYVAYFKKIGIELAEKTTGRSELDSHFEIKLAPSKTNSSDCLRLTRENGSATINDTPLEHTESTKPLSNVVEDIDLSDNTSSFELSNMHYKNCLFSPRLFENAQITNTVFERCSFNKKLANPFSEKKGGVGACQSTFSNVSFNDCDLSYHVFVKCMFNNVSFNRCDLSSSVFAFSDFFNTHIVSSELEATCFWINKIQESLIEGCSLINVFLLEAKKLFNFKECSENTFTKPVILFPTHFGASLRFAPLIIESLRKQSEGALVLLFDTCPTDIVDPSLLKKEILDSLAEIEKNPPANMLSRADEVLKRAQPGSLIDRIKERALNLMQMSSGLLIPGGGDIESEFYSQKDTSLTRSDVENMLSERDCLLTRVGGTLDLSIKNKLLEQADHLSEKIQRYFSTYTDESSISGTISEFALLQTAHKQGKAVLGICRGAQMINVFFGGTLRDVEDQDGYQELSFTDSPAAHKMQDYLDLKEPFIGYSCHEQAANVLGKGLSVILKFKDIVKLLIHKSGSIMGSQFHPEHVLEVPTEKSYKKDLEDEDSESISPSSYEAFLKANNGIYHFFMEKVMNVFKANLAPAQET